MPTVIDLAFQEMEKEWCREGNCKKSHFLCVDALTSRYKPLLELGKEYNASHPMNEENFRKTAPNIAQQLEGYRKLLDHHTIEDLPVYHRAQLHMSYARALVQALTENHENTKEEAKEDLLGVINHHLTEAKVWAERLVSIRELDITSEECVPMRDIIHGVADIKRWLDAREKFVTRNRDNVMDICHDSGLLEDGSASDSQYPEGTDLAAQGDWDGSDTVTERGFNDTVVDEKSPISDANHEGNEDPNAEDQLESNDLQDVCYEEFAGMAEEFHDKEVPVCRVEVEKDELFTCSELKIVWGFFHYFQHDKVGISNLMNDYLDKIDRNIDPNISEMRKLRKGLKAMDIKKVDETNETTPGSSESSFLSNPSTSKADTNSANIGGNLHKRRKVVEDDDDDDIL
ncbi:hypothetical protein SBOR_1279 [Sclerotinia borealis F-4128]|uniref:Uncharacterized protein n=1 Tax=Sclerotinia borealis (strain F-4128) TaxID=1432307 RepID=W9CR25_SCLBF|nr:hypothetical protein SBOR_1279 [Sclerotinia borealis F-4128]